MTKLIESLRLTADLYKVSIESSIIQNIYHSSVIIQVSFKCYSFKYYSFKCYSFKCHSSVIIQVLSFKCHSSVIQVLFKCYSRVIQVLFKCYSSVIHLLFKCHSSVIQVLFIQLCIHSSVIILSVIIQVCFESSIIQVLRWVCLHVRKTRSPFEHGAAKIHWEPLWTRVHKNSVTNLV